MFDKWLLSSPWFITSSDINDDDKRENEDVVDGTTANKQIGPLAWIWFTAAIITTCVVFARILHCRKLLAKLIN